MSAPHCWRSESQCARLRPPRPKIPRGGPRVEDRRVLAGMVPVLRSGLLWRTAIAWVWRRLPGVRGLCSRCEQRPRTIPPMHRLHPHHGCVAIVLTDPSPSILGDGIFGEHIAERASIRGIQPNAIVRHEVFHTCQTCHQVVNHVAPMISLPSPNVFPQNAYDVRSQRPKGEGSGVQPPRWPSIPRRIPQYSQKLVPYFLVSSILSSLCLTIPPPYPCWLSGMFTSRSAGGETSAESRHSTRFK